MFEVMWSADRAADSAADPDVGRGSNIIIGHAVHNFIQQLNSGVYYVFNG